MPFLRIDNDPFQLAERHVAFADDHDVVERSDWRFDLGGVQVT
jgi:hypothetical protein